ncbi:MAG: metallophosphoesterase [Phenylobacterium sp.]|nr:MAG: metallophosphoesterase [Phenylobacterium sp.]
MTCASLVPGADMRALASILFSLVFSLAFSLPATAAPLAAWVEVTGRGAEVRAVTEADTCPMLTVDGRRVRMRERAAPNETFANRMCDAPLPKTARRISVEGQRLPVPKARPNRLVILGDSGCRIGAGVTQNCNDPVAGWPFAKVAALAAAQKPDLVIHVGDYYYREKPCPDGAAACQGSPFGDRWPTWKAELFAPGAPLLKAAPWIFARGNHEDCKRGGRGWFRLLDADREAQACPTGYSTPFMVDLGGVRLAILDSAMPDDAKPQPDEVALFAKALAAIPPGPTPVWMVTHRPLWALSHNGATLGGDWGNVNERAAAQASGLKGVQLLIAGHVHNFTSFDFAGDRPPELIVGTGGDVQDPRDLPPVTTLHLAVDGVQTEAVTLGRFGYFVLDRKGKDWVGGFHDLSDALIVACRLHAGRLSCGAPPPDAL